MPSVLATRLTACGAGRSERVAQIMCIRRHGQGELGRRARDVQRSTPASGACCWHMAWLTRSASAARACRTINTSKESKTHFVQPGFLLRPSQRCATGVQGPCCARPPSPFHPTMRHPPTPWWTPHPTGPRPSPPTPARAEPPQPPPEARKANIHGTRSCCPPPAPHACTCMHFPRTRIIHVHVGTWTCMHSPRMRAYMHVGTGAGAGAGRRCRRPFSGRHAPRAAAPPGRLFVC